MSDSYKFQYHPKVGFYSDFFTYKSRFIANYNYKANTLYKNIAFYFASDTLSQVLELLTIKFLCYGSNNNVCLSGCGCIYFKLLGKYHS